MEEERQKKALESSKTKTQTTPLQQVGSGMGTGFVAMPAAQQLGGEGAAHRYAEPFAYNNDDYAEEHPRHESSPERRTGSGAKKGGEIDKTKEKENEKDKDIKTKKKKDKKLEDKKADLYLKTIERQLDKILELYDTVPLLKTIQTHVRSAEPLDQSLIESVRSITTAANRAVDQAKALTLHNKNLSKESADYYLDELKNNVTWYKDQFEPLMKEIKELEKDESTLAADRRYAYFGVVEQKEAASKIVKDIDTTVAQPVSLTEMVNTLQELYDIAIPKPKKTPDNPYGIEKPKPATDKEKEEDTTSEA